MFKEYGNDQFTVIVDTQDWLVGVGCHVSPENYLMLQLSVGCIHILIRLL